MAVAKSPFYVVKDFLSPKYTEIIVDNLGFYEPDIDTEGKPLLMQRGDDKSEEFIYDNFMAILPNIEEYYGFEKRGVEHISFEFRTAGVKPEAICDNSKWVNKKWVRTKDRDFSAILFLSDYQPEVPFDSDYEVFGGKLEFLQHGFGFNPERGTLIVYPSTPHFINAFAEILYGDLFVAKFHIAGSVPYQYFPDDFPGDYTSWFSDI